jgi:hypothetical protein
MAEETKETEEVYTMYKIRPKNADLHYCYVGHTSNFEQRVKHHTAAANIGSNKSHQKVYETIRNNGGWDEWEIIEIERVTCKTKLEARIREQELIEECGANLNTLKAYISEEERRQNKLAITAKYKIDNKEYVKKQGKMYKEEHKDKILEQMTTYRMENKDKIYEKSKAYNEAHKEKLTEWNKVWREQNKEILKEKRRMKTAEKKRQKLEEQEQKQVI